jgi:hypothetical protein
MRDSRQWRRHAPRRRRFDHVTTSLFARAKRFWAYSRVRCHLVSVYAHCGVPVEHFPRQQP